MKREHKKGCKCNTTNQSQEIKLFLPATNSDRVWTGLLSPVQYSKIILHMLSANDIKPSDVAIIS
jgi:hypothetical protein